MKRVYQATLFVAVLLLGMSSCEKEDFRAGQNNQATGQHDRKDGDEGDNDEPIIVGLAIDLAEPIYPAMVALFPESAEVASDSCETDSNGNFSFTVAEGSYYMKLYQQDVLLATSDTIVVSDSAYVVITP